MYRNTAVVSIILYLVGCGSVIASCIVIALLPEVFLVATTVSDAVLGFTIALLLWFQLIAPIRFIKMAQDWDTIFVLFNVVAAFFIFGILLYSYDSTGTYRPGYLDALG